MGSEINIMNLQEGDQFKLYAKSPVYEVESNEAGNIVYFAIVEKKVYRWNSNKKKKYGFKLES